MKWRDGMRCAGTSDDVFKDEEDGMNFEESLGDGGVFTSEEKAGKLLASIGNDFRPVHFGWR
jgi:hypothetical protein